MNSSTIVQKLWNYCNVLRDDGMSYGDYVEQLTYLLFLKMADERTKAPYNQESPVPQKWSWPELVKKDGEELFEHYRHTLEALGLLARGLSACDLSANDAQAGAQGGAQASNKPGCSA